MKHEDIGLAMEAIIGYGMTVEEAAYCLDMDIRFLNKQKEKIFTFRKKWRKTEQIVLQSKLNEDEDYKEDFSYGVGRVWAVVGSV